MRIVTVNMYGKGLPPTMIIQHENLSLDVFFARNIRNLQYICTLVTVFILYIHVVNIP